MITTKFYSEHAAKLRDPSIAFHEKQRIVAEVRDGIEIVHTAEYPGFLNAFFGAFIQIMRTTSPQAPHDSAEHKLRQVVLEVLYRLPHNDSLKSHVKELFDVCVAVLKHDKQENALLAFKIVFELHKNYRPHMEQYAPPVVELGLTLYEEFPETTRLAFEVSGQLVACDQAPSHRSFKLLAEFPLMLMFIFQIYNRMASTAVPKLLPLMMTAISLPGCDITSVKPEQAAAYHDLRQAQVKTMSFVAWLVRSAGSMMECYYKQTAASIIHLLKASPDSVTLRKELLVVTKHLMSTNIRNAFQSRIDELLDERNLIGTGHSSLESLRHDACALLGQFIHNVRKNLSLPQLSRIIHIFCGHVHDLALPPVVQYTCVRVLVGLVEVLFPKRVDPDVAVRTKARQLLTRIFHCMVSKLNTLRKQNPKLVASVKAERAAKEAKEVAAKGKQLLERERTMLYLEGGTAEYEKELNDVKTLLRSVMQSFHTILYSLIKFSQPSSTVPVPPPAPGLPQGLSLEEVQLLSRVVVYALQSFQLTHFTKDSKELFEEFAPALSTLEPCDLVEVFTARMDEIFQCLVDDPELVPLLNTLLVGSNGTTLAALLATYLVNNKMEVLAAHTSLEATLILKLFKLLFNGLPQIPEFEMVLAPPLSKMLEVSLKLAVEKQDPMGYLQLLRSFFRCVYPHMGKFSTLSDQLWPYVPKALDVILTMMNGPNAGELQSTLVELSLTLPAPIHKFYQFLPHIMKSLVQALEGNEELTLLGLKALEHWVDSLHPEFLEPAMANVMHSLMAALWALLKPTPLGSPPKPFSIMALQILGKLGGRNRKYLLDPIKLEYKDNPEHGLRLILTFRPNTSFLVPLDRCVALAKGGVFSGVTKGAPEKVSCHYRQQALQFLHVCLASVLNLRSPDDSDLPGTHLDKLTDTLFGCQPAPHVPSIMPRVDLGVKTKTQLTAERQVLVALLTAVIGAAADEELSELAGPFARGICRHFAMLFACGAIGPPGAPTMSRTIHESGQIGQIPHGLRELDVHLFLDALAEVLCDNMSVRARAALDALSVFLDGVMSLHAAQVTVKEAAALANSVAVVDPEELEAVPADPLDILENMEQEKAKMEMVDDGAGDRDGSGSGDGKKVGRQKDNSVAGALGLPPVLDEVLARVLHCCTADTWPARLGGAAGVLLLVHQLPAKYLLANASSMLHSLLMIIRWLPEHAVVEREEVKSTLRALIRKCLLGEEPLKSKKLQPSSSINTAKEPASPPPPPVVDPLPDLSAAADAFFGLPGSPLPPMSSDPPSGPSGPDPNSPSGPPHVTEKQLQLVVEELCTTALNAQAPSSMRTAAQECIAVVAECTTQSVSSLLQGMISSMQPPVVQRRLMPPKSVDVSSGQAEVLTYLLSQQPPLLPMSNELLMLVKEAIALSSEDEADLQKKLPASRFLKLESLVKLRVACIEVLCAVLSWEEFRENNDLANMRELVTQTFFKNLISSHADVISASKRGLELAVKHQKIPKNLLSQSLRPMLSKLAKANDLSMSLLQGLARLLELLSEWFRLELGEKLLEHLRKWLKPDELAAQQVAWSAGEEADIAAAILDLFHLLPKAAVKFLESQASKMADGQETRPGLLVLSIELEEKLAALQGPGGIPHPHMLTSPYRAPLTRFLNKYAPEAVAYFLEPSRMQNAAYFSRFLQIIRSPLGQPLLDQVCCSLDKLLAVFHVPQDADPTTAAAMTAAGTDMISEVQQAAQFHAVHLLSVLVKLKPDWLPQQRQVFEVVMQRWRSPGRSGRVRDEENLARVQLLESKRLAKCILNYISTHHGEVETLTDLFSIYMVKTSVDFSFIQDFCRDVVASKFSGPEKKALIMHFIDITRNNRLPQEQLVHLLHFLITPVLTVTLERKDLSCLDHEVVDALVKDILDPHDVRAAAYSEPMRIELVQLATLLLKNAPDLLHGHYKDLIKFGWNNLKRDDSSRKSYAFLNVAYFLKTFSAPEKIVLQVFVALLRACQSESKKLLIRQALDVLTPALIDRLPPVEGQKYPMWVRYTKKVLIEDGHSIAQLLHIWQLIVRHGDLFYPSRSQFIPQMVNSLSRLGIPQSTSLENRRLALDLAALIVHWEAKRAAGQLAPALSNGRSLARQTSSISRKRTRDESDPFLAIRASIMAPPVAFHSTTATTPVIKPDPEGDTTVKPELSLPPTTSLPAGGEGALGPPYIAGQGEGANAEGGDKAGQAREDDLQGPPSKMMKTEEGAVPTSVVKLESDTPQANGQGGAGDPAIALKSEDVAVRDAAAAAAAAATAGGEGGQPLPAPAGGQSSGLGASMPSATPASPTVPGPQAPEAATPSISMPPPTPAIGSPGSGGTTTRLGDDDFKPSPAMEEMVVNFLVRMAFLLDAKDPDHTQLHVYALDVLSQGLRLWPNASVKLTYLEKLMQQQLELQAKQQVQQAAAAPGSSITPTTPPPPDLLPVVVTGWEVAARVTEVAPHGFVQSCGSQLQLILEPTFSSRQEGVVQLMCATLRRIYEAYPLSAGGQAAGAPVNEATPLQQHLGERLRAHLVGAADVTQTLAPATPGSVTGRLCCSLAVLSALVDVTPPDFLTAFLQPMLDVIKRRVKEQTPGPSNNPTPHMRKPDNLEVEYGTPTWAMRQLLKLCAPRVVANQEAKKVMLTSMVSMQLGHAAKITDPVLFLDMLQIVEDWLLRPDPGSVHILSGKETVIMLQRAAGLEKMNILEGDVKKQFEEKLLKLVLTCCTSESLPPELRDELFLKVERMYMLGLRARQPEMRADFFKLYSNAVPPTLYDRLSFLVVMQEWDCMASHFWLKQALDLLLSVLKEEERIVLAPNSAQIPPLLAGTKQNVYNPPVNNAGAQGQASTPRTSAGGASGAAVATPKPIPKQEDPSAIKINEDEILMVLEGFESELERQGDLNTDGVDVLADLRNVRVRTNHIPVPQPMLDVMKQHIDFLENAGHLRVKDMLGSLREYAQVDPWVAYHLWVLVFPIVWASLEKTQQISLAKPIIALLSKEYHQRQAQLRPNVIQALLEGISLSQPQPKIPPELIKYLGKTFNAWHIAIPLLESHVIIFPDETRCFDSLVELYRLAAEEDVMLGMWRRRCSSEQTKIGLSLIQAGMWERAWEVLGNATANVGQAGTVNRGEQALWVDQWVYCAKYLNQWDVLSSMATSTENWTLAVDCLWRLADWPGLKDALQKAQAEDSANLLMCRAYKHLQDGEVSNGDRSINQAMQLALIKWWQLPEAGFVAQLGLLQVFQQLVELKESIRILQDLAQQPANHAYGEVKDILETWRLRTPNDWESLLYWQDLLLWRNQIYNIVINAFRNFTEVNPQLHQLGFKDKAWSVNKLGYVAYQHGLPEVCINIINNMYGYPAMEVQEAFIKIRQQAKAYLDLPQDLVAGLNLLNTTNLDYFQPIHQAEIFRLKGLYLQALDDWDSAQQAFSTALMLHRESGYAWLSWGAFCDTMYERMKGSNSADPSQAHMWLDYTVYCHIQALRLRAHTAIKLMPRILHLLAFDNEAGLVGAQLDKAADLAPWMWLVWIPQLLSSLQRPEVQHVKPILCTIALHFPQALYYSLRTFLLTIREHAHKAITAQQAARKKSSEDGGEAGSDGKPDEPRVEVVAFEVGKEVMEVLRGRHTGISQVLEALLQELGNRFVPKPEERLLAVVNALLHRCYKLPYASASEVPGLLKKELAGVCNVALQSEKTRNQVNRDVREAFVKDLNPEGPTFPKTLGELADKLKGWRHNLALDVEDKIPHVLHLADECRALQEMRLTEVEMPGQYLSAFAQMTPELSVQLECISSHVLIVRRHSTSYRRLAFHGSDGHVRHMLVQTGQNWQQGLGEEHMMQLLRLLNRLLEQHTQARKRHLAWHTPIMVPVWPQVRLLQEEPSYCTYGEAYEMNCARHGREPDQPIIMFKNETCLPNGAPQPDPTGSIRHTAYQRVMEQAKITENVFSQYIYKTLPTCNHLWVFKKYFCSQMALSALVCHMLYLGGRSPNKILLAKDTGRVFQTDFIPAYSDRGLLEHSEHVPFRLTRNLVSFFTPFGVEGVFVPVMCAAASALTQKHTNLPAVLSVFFRDDLTVWMSRRNSRGGPIPSIKNEHLRMLVQQNMKRATERVTALVPKKPVEGKTVAHSVYAPALDLVDAATSAKNLCRMEATWHPWF